MNVVRQYTEMQIQPAGFGTDGQATDGRQAITAIPAFQHRLRPTRCPCAPNRWSQHKAGFIEKNQVSVPAPGRLGNIGKTQALPKLDPGLVTFARLTTRFLRRPVQADAEKTTDMIMMERNAKMALNQLDDASTGPQLSIPAVGFGSFQKKSLQAMVLFGRQARRRTTM